MADVAQLVRASVCGTECREFESLHPPHILKSVFDFMSGRFFVLSFMVNTYSVILFLFAGFHFFVKRLSFI